MNELVDLVIECLTDKELLSNVLVLRERERLTLKELLDHLEEVYRRRVFADLGYSSLFKYLVKELKYSEGAGLDGFLLLSFLGGPLLLKR